MISFVFQFVRDDGLQRSGLEVGLPLTLLKEMESNIDLGQHLGCQLSQQKLSGQAEVDVHLPS